MKIVVGIRLIRKAVLMVLVMDMGSFLDLGGGKDNRGKEGE